MASKNVLLIFRSNIIYKPVIYRLVTDFDLVFNILEAKILPRREGRILLELRGEEDVIQQGIKCLEAQQVGVEYLQIRYGEKKKNAFTAELVPGFVRPGR